MKELFNMLKAIMFLVEKILYFWRNKALYAIHNIFKCLNEIDEISINASDKHNILYTYILIFSSLKS